MTDTQWPRYEVFKQDKLDKPHEAVGTVHAPDPEMALLNARDVFVRRPSAVSLWVAPATAVFAITAEEMAANLDWYQENITTGTPEQTFYLFIKHSQRRAMTFVQHVGEIKARTAVQAIHKAMTSEQFANQKIYVWWAVPESAITRSKNSNITSMFNPAYDKKYRQQSFYGFVHPNRKKTTKGKGDR